MAEFGGRRCDKGREVVEDDGLGLVALPRRGSVGNGLGFEPQRQAPLLRRRRRSLRQVFGEVRYMVGIPT